MYKLFFFCLAMLVFSFNAVATEIQVQTRLGSEIPVSLYKAEKADSLLLWIPSEYGIHGQEHATALALAKNGTEVWIADLHSAFFSAPGRSSYNNIKTQDIVDLIIACSQGGHRDVTLFATGRASVLALLAARVLQKDEATQSIVKSAVLFHPNFYTNTTDVGKTLQYLPITYASNLALYIVQPALSGKSYQLSTLAKHLQQGGSDVITQILPEVADGFNIRKADNAAEEKLYHKTPAIIRRAIKLLALYNKPRTAVHLAESATAPTTATINAGLQTYQGNITRPYLDFKDLHENRHTFESHKGRVLLLNFWASWCPPCVKELPSLTRLQNKIDDDKFEILAINIGEDRKKVKDFLAPMKINFPVLTDPAGTSVAPWKLVAFPSSFVIDKHGKIRYGLFGGIEWDNDQVIGIIKKLLSED